MPRGRGPHLVLVERPGDHAKAKPRRVTGYFVDKAERPDVLKLDPDRALFVLAESGFYVPADWELDLNQDSWRWFNATLVAQALHRICRDHRGRSHEGHGATVQPMQRHHVRRVELVPPELLHICG